MILKNNSLSGVDLFGSRRPFSMLFNGYRYFSEAFEKCNHRSALWISIIENSSFRKRFAITSCHWRKNI